ncbi:fumarylacetoacetate hydrolase family protein [Pseudobdellovibrio exovorus]|uniref:Fumarylacetoacetase-like C-terminal domain-containing protein n=1 Tax=Pseudobdellovibrio exovorus JSS TaxID=1184267 RepID=M4V9H4_9BACT|nr:fumarylacetoacetate hydrolase family protein [Pseudobdellovibrio exovorus]AGH95873.1 hypothetical protein A11Q_1657 [Pseudobdellovibrio exovorus JSS]
MSSQNSNNISRNIWAVGRNYANHARELNNEIPTTPVFFLKSGNCLETNSVIHLPTWSAEVHYELELALWLDENLSYSHFTLALDLTARDAQNQAKAKGLPWTLAKSFKGSCPIAPWVNLQEIESLDSLNFELFINKRSVQRGQSQDMIFKPQELLEYAKNHFPITAHDILLTGTPEGVGALRSGDSLDAILQSEDREILTCHWDVI